MEGAHQTEAFSKINPYQHIPALEDGDFAIGESVAILRYIALKVWPRRPTPPPLYPTLTPTFTPIFTPTFTLA